MAYSNTVSFQAPTDFNEERAAIERQRKYAEALMQQGKMPTGQMVGNIYVAPSWTQQLNEALKPVLGAYTSNKADEKTRDLNQRVNETYAEELRKYGELSQGTPDKEKYSSIGPDGMPVFETAPGMKPDPNAALRHALAARNPLLQQIAMQQLAKQNEAYTLGPGQVRFSGNQQIAAVPEKPVKEQKPTAIQEYEFAVGQGYPGTFQQWVATNKKPLVTVDARNINTQENEQSKAYGKALGELRSTINQSGWDAPKKMKQLDRMEELLAGIDGGAAAPTMAQIASFANSFGIKLDPKLGAKDAAEALARDMAGALRQPGTGPMTDKDFENFMRQIPSLSKTAEGRAQITKTMRAALKRDIEAAKFAREYARKNGGVIDDNFFDAVANFYAENPVVQLQMPPTNAAGMPFSDPAKEQRYQQWLNQRGAR